MRKTYFAVHIDSGTSSAFSKVAFTLLDNPHIVLIHYLGDSSAIKSIPHGNSKHNTRPHKRTCPSVIESLKHENLYYNKPNKVYKASVTATNVGGRQGTANSRNLKQVQHAKESVDKKKSLGTDDVKNLFELAMHLGTFVKIIDLWPEFVCVLILEDIAAELNNLLQDQSK